MEAAVISLRQFLVYSNRKVGRNADSQGKPFFGQMTYRFAFLSDRPTFGVSRSLKKKPYFWRRKRGLLHGYNILLEAPALDKCHLMEETQVWTLNFRASEWSSPRSPNSWLYFILFTLTSLTSLGTLYNLTAFDDMSQKETRISYSCTQPTNRFPLRCQPSSRASHFEIEHF